MRNEWTLYCNSDYTGKACDVPTCPMKDGSMCAGMVFVKKVVATVCQGGREVTAPWYAKMTAADTVFVAPKSLTNASNPGWRVHLH